MRLTVLGSGREIGASSYLLEIDGKNLLVDCGARIQRNPGVGTDSLPDIDLIEKLDLVLLTHAHLDHVGGLPAIYQMFGNVKTICTRPTFHLMVALLRDWYQIEHSQLLLKGDGNPIQLEFDDQAIEEIAKNVFLCNPGVWFKPFREKNIRICFIPAGHILGASAILITGKAGSIMFSGDFSLTDQKTVRGLQISDIGPKPDVLVCESTYGDKAHETRSVEERRLAQSIGKILTEGGRILIPTFAVGRAQELILLLRSFKESKVIPPYPVYTDGLVRRITAIYESIINRSLVGDQVSEVQTELRDTILATGEPCCIISSSGSLIGGPSVSYARQIVRNEKDAILFSGYQDEESPGQKLIDLKTGDAIQLEGESNPIHCRVECFNLSAHADAPQLRHFIHSLSPRAVVLTHGQADRSESLGKSLLENYDGLVWVPYNGMGFNPLSAQKETTALLQSGKGGKR